MEAVFCFNQGSRPLYYVADLDVILCLEQEGTCLRLLDVVLVPTVPPLAAIVEEFHTPSRKSLFVLVPTVLRLSPKPNPTFLITTARHT